MLSRTESKTVETEGGWLWGQAAAAAEEGQELIKEVWEIVALKYLDARDSGFDQERWAARRDAALASPIKDKAAAYRCVHPKLCSEEGLLIMGNAGCSQCILHHMSDAVVASMCPHHERWCLKVSSSRAERAA